MMFQNQSGQLVITRYLYEWKLKNENFMDQALRILKKRQSEINKIHPEYGKKEKNSFFDLDRNPLEILHRPFSTTVTKDCLTLQYLVKIRFNI